MWAAQYGQHCARLQRPVLHFQESCSNCQFEIILISRRGAAFLVHVEYRSLYSEKKLPYCQLCMFEEVLHHGSLYQCAAHPGPHLLP